MKNLLLSLLVLLPCLSQGAQPTPSELAGAVLERYEKFTIPERQAAIAGLAARAETASLLLDAMGAGKVARAEMPSFVARQISELGDEALKQKLEKVWGRIGATAPGAEDAAKEHAARGQGTPRRPSVNCSGAAMPTKEALTRNLNPCFIRQPFTVILFFPMSYDPYQPPPIPDPYRPPSASLGPGAGFGQQNSVSPLTVQHLVRTQPWVRLIAITGLVLTGIGLVIAVFAMMMAASNRTTAELAGIMLGPMILFAVIYLYPLLKLKAYAAAIRKLERSFSTVDLEEALNHQRSFWKFVGILFLIGIVFYGVIFLMALAAPTAMKFGR